jgi:hypothetical protein
MFSMGFDLCKGDSMANTATQATSDARRAERFDVMLDAAVVRLDGSRTDVTVRNVSRYGFMAEGVGMLARGDALTLHLRDGSMFPAHVSWSRDDRAGASFIVPLASEDLIKLI